LKSGTIQIKTLNPVRFVFILAAATLALSACMQPPDCFREDVFCAALVTDTLGLDDHGVSQDTWAGLAEAKANGLIDHIASIESVGARDYEKNITYFADEGYDVIITTGAGMRDETLQAADRYPDSVFISINQAQRESRPNLVPVTFAEDQMGFLAGALAARLSKLGIVGAVCETSGIEAMWRYCEGFREGAKYVDENIKILVAYRDEGDSEKLFVDEAWGHETANKLIFRGADVIFAAGGATGQGALRAATEADIPAIGAERDQAAALGESGKGVVTSIFGRTSFEVQEVMRLVKDGNVPEPRTGQFWYVPLSQKFPESFKNEMDSLLFELWIGEIKTNVTLKKP
jgi:basic membrane protein A and related proteins